MLRSEIPLVELVLRIRTRTSSPRSTSWRVTCEPRNPLTPITSFLALAKLGPGLELVGHCGCCRRQCIHLRSPLHSGGNLYCNVFSIKHRLQEGRSVKVPFTWKVTGWFMIGWSPEFPVGEVRPLRYFSEDLVAYRDESNNLNGSA